MLTKYFVKQSSPRWRPNDADAERRDERWNQDLVRRVDDRALELNPSPNGVDVLDHTRSVIDQDTDRKSEATTRTGIRTPLFGDAGKRQAD
jgi:hypothetical protein